MLSQHLGSRRALDESLEHPQWQYMLVYHTGPVFLHMLQCASPWFSMVKRKQVVFIYFVQCVDYYLFCRWWITKDMEDAKHFALYCSNTQWYTNPRRMDNLCMCHVYLWRGGVACKVMFLFLYCNCNYKMAHITQNFNCKQIACVVWVNNKE